MKALSSYGRYGNQEEHDDCRRRRHQRGWQDYLVQISRPVLIPETGNAETVGHTGQVSVPDAPGRSDYG